MHPAYYGFLTIMRYAIPRTHSLTLCRRSVVHSSGEHNFPRGGWRRQYSRDSSCEALSLCVSAMRCCRCCCCLHNARARRAVDPDILASPASTVDSNQRPAPSQVNRGDGSLSLSLSLSVRQRRVERFPATMKSKYRENTGAVRYFFPTTSLATAKLGRLVGCDHSDWNTRRSELEFSSMVRV